jgi:hypothetical protein
VTSPDPDPDLQILREAEARRGGCGAALVGYAVFFLVLAFHALILLTLGQRLDPLPLFAAAMAGFVSAIAAAIWAARQFTRLRLRLTGKGSPKEPPPPEA